MSAAVKAATRRGRGDAAADQRTLAMPVERTEHACFPVTVTAVAQPAPHVRRLTLAAPELVRLTMMGPDEFFGLVMPRAGQQPPTLTDIEAPTRGRRWLPYRSKNDPTCAGTPCAITAPSSARST